MNFPELRVCESILLLNETLTDEISDAMKSVGFETSACIVFDMFPDSSDTFIVRLMDNFGITQELDLDINEPSKSEISILEKEFFDKKSGKITLKVIQKLFEAKKDAS